MLFADLTPKGANFTLFFLLLRTYFYQLLFCFSIKIQFFWVLGMHCIVYSERVKNPFLWPHLLSILMSIYLLPGHCATAFSKHKLFRSFKIQSFLSFNTYVRNGKTIFEKIYLSELHDGVIWNSQQIAIAAWTICHCILTENKLHQVPTLTQKFSAHFIADSLEFMGIP